MWLDLFEYQLIVLFKLFLFLYSPFYHSCSSQWKILAINEPTTFVLTDLSRRDPPQWVMWTLLHQMETSTSPSTTRQILSSAAPVNEMINGSNLRRTTFPFRHIRVHLLSSLPYSSQRWVNRRYMERRTRPTLFLPAISRFVCFFQERITHTNRTSLKAWTITECATFFASAGSLATPYPAPVRLASF